jgi:hypothetical protein
MPTHNSTPQEIPHPADQIKQRRKQLSTNPKPCAKVAHAGGGYQPVGTICHHSTTARATISLPQSALHREPDQPILKTVLLPMTLFCPSNPYQCSIPCHLKIRSLPPSCCLCIICSLLPTTSNINLTTLPPGNNTTNGNVSRETLHH